MKRLPLRRAPGRRRRVAAFLALTLATLLALSGCNIAVQGGSSGAGEPGAVLIAADTGSPTMARNFNPFASSARVGAKFMYEPLGVMNQIDGKDTMFLATGYRVENPTTIVFTIRRGVTWTDGADFTPADVAFTFGLLKAHVALDTTGVWQHVKSVAVSGDDVTFHLLGPDVPAAQIIENVPIVPQHIWSGVADPVTFTNQTPVVTGPYTLGTFNPNEYTLVKNDHYWQADKVAIDKLVFPGSNSQLDIVDNGYDWAYSFLTDVQNTWVKQNGGKNVYWYPPGGTIALFPNLTKAPFNNLNFRQALSYSLNRKQIADTAEQGYVQPAGQSGLLLPNQQKWLDPSLPNGGNISQDTAKALSYYQKAGYHQSGGKMVDASGRQLVLTITTANGYSDWLQGVQTVQKQLSALGISVKINQPQPAAYAQQQQNGTYDLIVGSYGGTGSVYQDFNNLLNSKFAAPIGTATTANYQRFKSPAADKLLAQYQATSDPATQLRIAHQLEQIVYTQLPAIGMFYGGLWGLFSNANFTGWPSQADPYAPPITWMSSVLLILTHLKKAS
ncbi:peptide/nickel transport system substrate-binding protein [Nakamurella panacisegetis]|uniref:Peptide/nickel transport system substrate-binding protein n=1 Tax=Nakamurella panacisegetis TaxID=1090615 RepID=A0A1H0I0R1_9ACTN|nr:ABC transporter substrate-binding protein [Nakamurella panacisegetis]SDO24995.1 peptide/nickel transport system substrate-binding protein [Nakamurella panacisegetis]